MTTLRNYFLFLLATNLIIVNFILGQQCEAFTMSFIEGSTCENPYWITLPLESFEGDTEPMGNHYDKDMISPSSNYINGNDMVFKFTVNESGLLLGNLTASDAYVGVFIMQDCPDPDNPVLLAGWSTSYLNTLTIPSDNPNQPQEILLLPGNYFLIVSSYPPPETIQFTLNLWLEPLSECPQPILPDVTDISNNSAFLGWSETGDASQWDILYGEAGFDPDTEGTLIEGITQNPYSLAGLTANTSYDFYVRSVCDENMVSDWTGPKAFTTECDFAFSTAFTAGFESENTPPQCWQIWYENPNPPADNLMTHSLEASYSGDRSFRFSSWVSGPPYFQFLRTPELDFDAELEVSFKYQGVNDVHQVLFSVGFSEDGQGWTWGEDISDADNTWKGYNSVFPSSTRYIAIQYKGNYMRYLFVDDFSVAPSGNPEISLTPDEFSFAVSQGYLITDNLYISNIGDADLSYTASVETMTNSFDEAGNISGDQWLSIAPGQGIISPETTDTAVLTVDVGNLPAGFYQVNILINSNDPDNPTISVPVTLDVLVGIEESRKDMVMIYPLPAKNLVNITATAAIISVEIFNDSGKSLQQINGNGLPSVRVNAGHLPSGIYPVRVVCDAGIVLTGKIIIQ